MEDLVEYTSPFHNWKHLRDDMKSIADEWGGSGSGGGGGAGASPAVVPSATEKAPPTSGGTMTSSFFGKRRPSKDSTMAAAAALALQYKGTVSSSGLGSKVSSSTSHAKEKELKMGQQDKDTAAKASQPKGCIPFLGTSTRYILELLSLFRSLGFRVFFSFFSFVSFTYFVSNLVK